MARRLIKVIASLSNPQANPRVAKVYRDAEWNEYRVVFCFGDSKNDAATYHTDDKDDAISTGQTWVNEGESELAQGPVMLPCSGYRDGAIVNPETVLYDTLTGAIYAVHGTRVFNCHPKEGAPVAGWPIRWELSAWDMPKFEADKEFFRKVG